MSRFVDDLHGSREVGAARTSSSCARSSLGRLHARLALPRRSSWATGAGCSTRPADGVVVGDPQRLTQAMVNLADNAVQPHRRRGRDRDRQRRPGRHRPAVGARHRDGSRARRSRADLRAVPAGPRHAALRGHRPRALRSCGRSPRRMADGSSSSGDQGEGARFEVVLPGRSYRAGPQRLAEKGRQGMSRILIVEDEARLAQLPRARPAIERLCPEGGRRRRFSSPVR